MARPQQRGAIITKGGHVGAGPKQWHTIFPKDHWTKNFSTNPIERLKGEIKR